jgi:glycosyltransferase involved in cell wall biosynthesis
MRILWLPHAGWHIPQRAHLFCRSLAERHTVHVTDWVADFASLRDCLSYRYLRNFSYRRYSDGPITVHGVPRIAPALFHRSIRSINTAIFATLVRHLIKRYRIDVVVGTFVLPPQPAPRLVFDLFDENVAAWRQMGHAYADEIALTERMYLHLADAVVASSSVLADKARQVRQDDTIHIIPNGVDVERFARADGTRFRQQWNIRGALVGSVANHDKMEELERILGAAELLTKEEMTFLIAGRGAAMAKAQQQAQQRGLSNVIFQGFVPPDEVADLIAALDVGLCPYDQSAMDDARSSMRLLAYTAAGVPTVCTALEEVRRSNFPNVILVDESARALADGIRQAQQQPRLHVPQIAEFDTKRLVAAYEAVLCTTTPDAR